MTLTRLEWTLSHCYFDGQKEFSMLFGKKEKEYKVIESEISGLTVVSAYCEGKPEISMIREDMPHSTKKLRKVDFLKYYES